MSACPGIIICVLLSRAQYSDVTAVSPTVCALSGRGFAPIPEGLDMAKSGPLLCGGVTVFAPLVINKVRPTARVGIVGIGGLGHMALQFANKWGCEVHAFTTSDSKEAEALKLGAHFVHNTKQEGTLKRLARSLDFIIGENLDRTLHGRTRGASRDDDAVSPDETVTIRPPSLMSGRSFCVKKNTPLLCPCLQAGGWRDACAAHRKYPPRSSVATG